MLQRPDTLDLFGMTRVLSKAIPLNKRRCRIGGHTEDTGKGMVKHMVLQNSAVLGRRFRV